jgi:hypothetical protein
MDFPSDIERNAEEFNKLVDSIRDAATADAKGKMLSETNFTLDGHPGRMLKAANLDGSIANIKVYAVGKRFYSVSITIPKELLTTDGGKFDELIGVKFFNSFKLAKHVDGGRIKH